VRVDPLTHEFAMVAAPWREVQVDTAGHRVDESGFFRAITEYRGGRWQFRDAHWSSTLTGIKGDGYAFDSGSPYRLWFALLWVWMDDPVIGNGIHGDGLLG